jgi:hypothetical protein
LYARHSGRLPSRYETRRQTLDVCSRELRAAREPGGTEGLRNTLDYLLGLKATLEQQLVEVANWRGLPPGQNQDIAKGQYDVLKASLVTLQRGGVTRYGNSDRIDGIPNPLLALLTKTCASCGHQSVNWVGSIAQEEERVAEADQRIPYDRQRLDTALQRAEALLAAETVSV